jgi:hypothetical protein
MELVVERKSSGDIGLAFFDAVGCEQLQHARLKRSYSHCLISPARLNAFASPFDSIDARIIPSCRTSEG